MPGMMDTILNLGLNDEAVEGLAARTGNRRFAYDSYRRLIQMFGEVVDGIDGHRFEDALTALKRDRGVTQDTDLSADDLAALVETYRGIYREEKGAEFPAERDRAADARRAAPSSTRGTPRARRSTGARTTSPTTSAPPSTSSRWCSATRATGPGPGVAFTRNPSTGAKELYGEFLANAQGEDVVAGIRTPQPVESMGADHARRPTSSCSRRSPARGALPRHAGRRVHRRGRRALHAPDAVGEAHRRRGAQGRGRDGRRRA